MGFKLDVEAITKRTQKAVQEKFQKKVAGLCCPVHGKAATVVPQSMSGSEWTWEVRACCAEFKKKVHETLRK